MKEEYDNKFQTFGFNLKEIRESKKITLKKLSIKTKINKRYLKKIENGKAFGLTITKILIIAEALKIPPHLFVEKYK